MRRNIIIVKIQAVSSRGLTEKQIKKFCKKLSKVGNSFNMDVDAISLTTNTSASNYDIR